MPPADAQAVYVCVRNVCSGAGAIRGAPATVAAARRSRTGRGCIEGRGRDRRLLVSGIELELVCVRVRDELTRPSWTCCGDYWERDAVNWGSAKSESGLCMSCTSDRTKGKGLDSAAWAWYWVGDGRVEELE
jgi:hypothetical protein